MAVKEPVFKTTTYKIAFALGMLFIFGAIVTGVYESLRVRNRLPGLEISAEYFLQIDTLLRRNNYKLAAEQIQRAADLDFPHQKELLRRLAKTARQYKDFETEVAALKRLASLDAMSDFDVLTDLSSALQERVRQRIEVDKVVDKDVIKEAVEISDRAAQLRPDSARANCNLASSLLMAGQTDHAESFFRRAIQLDPNLVPARQGLEHINQLRRAKP